MAPIRAADMVITDADLMGAARLFGIDEIEPIGGYESALYRSIRPQGRILRITHTSRRSTELVAAEFSYMEHLASHAVPVVAPIRSREGHLAEPMTTGADDSAVVSCMTEAPGRFRQGRTWSDAEIVHYGSILGKLHSAAGTYRPAPGLSRPGWTHPIFDIGFEARHDEDLAAVWQATRQSAQAHPAGAETLLIHQDAHLGNLFITDTGDITLFDFDDCAYGTPTHDVAIVLFYWLAGVPAVHQAEVRRFLQLFLMGYRRHGDLPEGWQEGIDVILKLRELEIYHLVSTSNEEPDEWSVNFMRDRRRRILRGAPYADVPIAELI